jgi:hypothetical protein
VDYCRLQQTVSVGGEPAEQDLEVVSAANWRRVGLNWAMQSHVRIDYPRIVARKILTGTGLGVRMGQPSYVYAREILEVYACS